ncbi:ABC-three component system protein [Kribbella sp. CWNU-51]
MRDAVTGLPGIVIGRAAQDSKGDATRVGIGRNAIGSGRDSVDISVETIGEGVIVGMNFYERLAARFLLTAKFAELNGEQFETFFQDLMAARHEDFLDVRTAGSLGDLGSDGISLYSGKLYACYGPKTLDEKKVSSKFAEDLAKAKAKRPGEFEIFVFVHNDLRGVHPKVAGMIAKVNASDTLAFENFGFRKFRDEVMKLDRTQAEDLLGAELPVQDMVFGIGLDELKPLLDHLSEHRVRPDVLQPLEAPSESKLDYNEFSDDTREEIVRLLYLGTPIDAYYANRVDVTERDEVASGFREEYERLRQEYTDPDLVFWGLERYILGNASVPLRQSNVAKAVVTYFFQSCDVFDNPPAGWATHERTAR